MRRFTPSPGATQRRHHSHRSTPSPGTTASHLPTSRATSSSGPSLEQEIAKLEEILAEYTGLKREFDIRKEEDLLRVLRHLKPIALERFNPPWVRDRVAPYELPGVVTDWNFYDANWALDTQTYVSSPSSIRFNAGNFALLKQSAVGQGIVSGRVETYHRTDGFLNYYGYYYYPTITFRSNASDGSVSPTCVYVLELYNLSGVSCSPATSAILFLYLSGSYYLIGTRSLSTQLSANAWNRIRATWWVSQGVLIVRLEYYNGTDWVKLCDDFTDNRNAGASNAVNRVGVGSSRPYTYGWHDDTIVYVAV